MSYVWLELLRLELSILGYNIPQNLDTLSIERCGIVDPLNINPIGLLPMIHKLTFMRQ